jgi:hypothetical protein
MQLGGFEVAGSPAIIDVRPLVICKDIPASVLIGPDSTLHV